MLTNISVTLDKQLINNSINPFQYMPYVYRANLDRTPRRCLDLLRWSAWLRPQGIGGIPWLNPRVGFERSSRTRIGFIPIGSPICVSVYTLP